MSFESKIDRCVNVTSSQKNKSNWNQRLDLNYARTKMNVTQEAGESSYLLDLLLIYNYHIYLVILNSMSPVEHDEKFSVMD